MALSPTLNVMMRAADKAVRGLKRDFGEVEQLQVSMKGPADFVSAADRRAEKILHEELSRARPDFGFLMEEGGEIAGKDSSHRWIVDPLDGTTNFIHGLPHFAISIALEREGEIVAALVHDPIKNEVFLAEKGGGAFLNDRRIRVSARRDLREALIATGIPFHGRGGDDPRQAEIFQRQLAAVMQRTAGVRRWGAAALDLAYVAAGRYEGFWEAGLSAWDVAAGILLVREAGGTVTDLDGKDYHLAAETLVAGNDKLHGTLRQILV